MVSGERNAIIGHRSTTLLNGQCNSIMVDVLTCNETTIRLFGIIQVRVQGGRGGI